MKFYGKITRAHFIGIGGSGMSGIAELCLAHGLSVTGSDAKESEAVERLRGLGAIIVIGHHEEEADGADVVVYSSAIAHNHPALVRAQALNIAVIPRAEMLAELLRLSYAVLVAGSHGKTTVTSMIADLLTRGGLDPTVVIGGRLGRMGSGARLGASQLTVAEADESDGSFLLLRPAVCVITNIDREHLDHYGSYDRLLAAYVDFANQAPFFGRILLCVDDPGARSILGSLRRPVTTYGTTADCDLQIEALALAGLGARFRLRGLSGSAEFSLSLPGRHNVLNAAAALGAAAEVGLSWEKAAPLLDNFHNADRRFEFKGEARGVSVYDDYGHHPTEVMATLAAARAAFPGRRLIAAFEPHRYSRTQLCFAEFTRAFDDCDRLFLTEIYPAGEAPRSGITGRALANAIAAAGRPVEFVATVGELPARLAAEVKAGDVVLTLGAGAITGVGPQLLSRILSREEAISREDAKAKVQETAS